MEDNNSKRGQLKAIVLLLIGFIIGFATHAFTVSKEGVILNDEKSANEELIDAPIGSDDADDTEDILTDDTSVVEDDPKGSDEPEKTPLDATPNNSSNDGYSFSVVDQSAGGVVYVSQLVFTAESWVAIREDSNGDLGNILGARRYPAGTHTGAVELLRDTEPGQTYYAVVYVDDGDKDFDHKKDVLLTDKEGVATAAIFRTY